jgi:hypothetical protein
VEATGVAERQDRLQAVRESISDLLGRPPEAWQLKAAFRVFGRQLVLSSCAAPMAEWRLYREINIEHLQGEEQRLARPLSTAEARYRLRTAMAAQPARFPTLRQLAQTLARYASPQAPGGASNNDDDEDDDDDSQAPRNVRRLEQFVERRLLTTCRRACPSCLVDQECEVEIPARQGQLLNRHLLAELLEWKRLEVVVTVPDTATPNDVLTEVRNAFERLPAGLARLRFRPPAASAVEAALRLALADGLEVALTSRRIGQLGDRMLDDGSIEITLGLRA